MEIDAFPEGFARLPADTVVLRTLQILPRILGVHVRHDAIPLQLGIFLQGLAEQLVDCFQLGVLMDICLYELVDRNLE
jgi:hypothetical protein